jgi:hypothetical protein
MSSCRSISTTSRAGTRSPSRNRSARSAAQSSATSNYPHVALNTIIDDNGEQQQIMRFNMPFGRIGAGEFGTYFIGYARSPDVIEQMLTNMFIGKPVGNYDRILDFSTAVTGNLFFVPTADFLDDPPRAKTAPAAAVALATVAAPEDGSLGIGSLKRASPGDALWARANSREAASPIEGEADG